MLKIIATIFATLATVAVAHAADGPDFKVGQMWTVKNSDIKIVIGRIEPFPGDRTVISISAFDIPCPPGFGCTTTVLAHAPFDSKTLAASVDKLVSTDAQLAPQFEEGYQTWKAAHAGAFTVPVSELPDMAFRTIQQGKPAPHN